MPSPTRAGLPSAPWRAQRSQIMKGVGCSTPLRRHCSTRTVPAAPHAHGVETFLLIHLTPAELRGGHAAGCLALKITPATWLRCAESVRFSIASPFLLYQGRDYPGCVGSDRTSRVTGYPQEYLAATRARTALCRVALSEIGPEPY